MNKYFEYEKQTALIESPNKLKNYESVRNAIEMASTPQELKLPLIDIVEAKHMLKTKEKEVLGVFTDVKKKFKEYNDILDNLESEIKTKVLSTIKFDKIQKFNQKTGEIYEVEKSNLPEKCFSYTTAKIKSIIDYEAILNDRITFNEFITFMPQVDKKKVEIAHANGFKFPMKIIETNASVGVLWKSVKTNKEIL